MLTDLWWTQSKVQCMTVTSEACEQCSRLGVTQNIPERKRTCQKDVLVLYASNCTWLVCWWLIILFVGKKEEPSYIYIYQALLNLIQSLQTMPHACLLRGFVRESMHFRSLIFNDCSITSTEEANCCPKLVLEVLIELMFRLFPHRRSTKDLIVCPFQRAFWRLRRSFLHRHVQVHFPQAAVFHAHPTYCEPWRPTPFEKGHAKAIPGNFIISGRRAAIQAEDTLPFDVFPLYGRHKSI